MRRYQQIFAALRVTIGLFFLTAFIENLNKGIYGPEGYATIVNHLALINGAPAFWKSLMEGAADSSSFNAPLVGTLTATVGVSLILGIATGIGALVGVYLLTTIWISLWGIQLGSISVWQIVIPIVACILIASASLPQLKSGRTTRERLLGPPTFVLLGPVKAYILASMLGLAVVAVVLVTRTGGPANYGEVALEAGLATAALMAGLAYIDRKWRRETI